MNKKTLLSNLAIPLLLVGACSDSIPMPSDIRDTPSCAIPKMAYPHSPEYICKTTRAGLSFGTDWEHFEKIKLNNGKDILLPWASQSIGSHDREVAEDIKKEDGWTMLAHTISESNSNEMDYYTIILYNQKTADLKLFCYYGGYVQTYNTGFWQIAFRNPQGWLNAENAAAMPMSCQITPSDGYLWQSTIMSTPFLGYFQKGWNMIVIPNLCYDTYASKKQNMVIETIGKTVSSLTLTGNSEGSTRGTIVSHGSTNPFSKLESTITTYTGKAIDKWEWHKSSTRGLIETGVKDLLKMGINLATHKFFGLFSRPTEQIYSVRLTTNTRYNYGGKEVTQGGTGIPTKGFDVGYSTTGIELGAWNLVDNPTIYINPWGKLIPDNRGEASDEWTYEFKASGKYKIDVVINPQLLPYVKKYWVECQPVFYMNGKAPQPFKAPIDYGPIGTSGTQNGAFPDLDTSSNNLIYKDSIYELYKSDMKTKCTYLGLTGKYGYTPNPVYAPDNNNLLRGGRYVCNVDYTRVKVTLYMATEFENKIDTIVETRTYVPKFDWDPSLINNKYSTFSKKINNNE